MNAPPEPARHRIEIPPVLKYSAVGLVIAGALAALLFLANRGSQVRLNGEIVKVRTINTDENASIAIVEFRFNNPARVDFMVREAKLILTTADGQTHEAEPIAETDLDRVLSYYQLAGPRYNPTLKRRERFAGGSTVDRTIAGSFPVAEAALASRRGLTITVEDADGVVVEIAEKR